MPSLSLLTGLPGVTNVLSGPTSISVGVNTLSLTTTNLLGCTAVTPISVTGVALPAVAPISLSLCAGATVSVASLVSSVPSLSLLTGLPGVTNVLSGPTSISVGVNTLKPDNDQPLRLYSGNAHQRDGCGPAIVAPISLSSLRWCYGSVASLVSSVPSLSLLTGLPGVTNVLSGPTSISVGVNTLSLTTTNLLGCTAVTPISVTGVALPA